MSRGREIRKSLAFGLGAMLLLPVVLAIVLGLGGLLSALGDAPGATFCLRAGLFIAVLWLTSIVATVAVTAVVQVSGEAGRKPRRPSLATAKCSCAPSISRSIRICAAA